MKRTILALSLAATCASSAVAQTDPLPWLTSLKNHGFAIQQIGLDYFPRMRGKSHLSSPKVILKIFAELLQLYPEMRKKHPERERGINAGIREKETPRRRLG